MRDSVSVITNEEVLSDEIQELKNSAVDAFEKAKETQVHVNSKRLSPLGRTFIGNTEPDTNRCSG